MARKVGVFFSNLSARRTVGRFVAKTAFFAASLAALLMGCELLVTSTTAWRQYEDPRARILWDGAFDGTRILLLGGSEFSSNYVDSLSDTLWARLEAYTGQRVFPGALSAARPLDMLAGAVHVSREWPKGTTVFIGLSPTRFVVSRAEEPPKGNFSAIYFRRYGIDVTNGSVLRRAQGRVYSVLLKPFFAERTRSALANLVDHPRPPAWMHHRVWLREPEVAKELFDLFERNLVMGARGPANWVDQIKHLFDAAGMRPVFVLTPLNELLVRTFARRYPADAILHQLRGGVADVAMHLDETGATVIVLTDSVPAECFVDLVHVNTRGDDAMAIRLAEWLKQHSED